MQKEKNMVHIRHFIWDFDGTLYDTYPTITKILRTALGQFGHDCDPVEAMSLMLDNIGVARDHYADKYGIDREALKEVYLHHHSLLTPQFLDVPFPGVKEVLEKICASGRHNYIFTHRVSPETIAYLKKHNLTGYFREMVCPDSPNFATKPSPDAVLYLMKKYEMTAQNAVMMGDRDCDLESARRAGICTAHKVCPLVPQQLDCDWKFNSFDELLKMI